VSARTCQFGIQHDSFREIGSAPESRIDVPVGLAIVGLGILIVIAPSSVPGLTPPMCDVIARARPSYCDDKKERKND
jgi:hypothetical protein